MLLASVDYRAEFGRLEEMKYFLTILTFSSLLLLSVVPVISNDRIEILGKLSLSLALSVQIADIFQLTKFII